MAACAVLTVVARGVVVEDAACMVLVCHYFSMLVQVTTLLSEADKRIAETAASGTKWLEEASAAAETVTASAAQEAEQGEKIRSLKEQVCMNYVTNFNAKTVFHFLMLDLERCVSCKACVTWGVSCFSRGGLCKRRMAQGESDCCTLNLSRD